MGLCDRMGAILVFGVAIPLNSICVADNVPYRKKIHGTMLGARRPVGDKEKVELIGSF